MSTQKRQRAALADHHVEALLATFKDRYSAQLRDKTMIEVMYRAGLRIGEVIALQLTDVPDLATPHRRLLVRHGKGDKRREVPFGPTLARALERWLEGRGSSPELGTLLFPNFRAGCRGRPVDQRNFRATLKVRAEKAGLDPQLIFPHALRHTYATGMLSAGEQLVTVKELLGHERIDTTARYMHPTQADLTAAVNRADRGTRKEVE